MGHERWDIVLRILTGPLQSASEQTFRGPSVGIGTHPGPGGLSLNGYRGLDPRQCTITSNAKGIAQIVPQGTNQVRLAPHAHVDWATIEPIRQSALLSEGCALHIGPVGRGATLQFVGCHRLGAWSAGGIRSQTLGPSPVAGRDPLRVQRVQTSSIPTWFVGGCTLLALSTMTVLLIMTGVALFGLRPTIDLRPSSDEYEYFAIVPLDNPLDEKLLKGLEQPMMRFVMRPNRKAADGRYPELDEPKNWDEPFVNAVAQSVQMHSRQRKFWGNLDRKRKEWGIVVQALREADLPEVLAAMPYQESLYRSKVISPACARGYWQFMPETAHRVDTLHGIEFRVRDCRIAGRAERWTPRDLAPRITTKSIYIEQGECLIDGCRVDDRIDLRKSTAAAIATLGEAWNHEEIRASGSAVQATILTHNAGLDDSPWKRGKHSNILPALRRFITKNGEDRGPHFYGDSIQCTTHQGRDTCGSVLMPESQHYAYNIVAQHFLAVCYYSKNYGYMPEFQAWETWALPDSYCSKIPVPTSSEARGW